MANSNVKWACASLGAAIGAIAAKTSPKARTEFFSRERGVGSWLGLSAGLAVGYLVETMQQPAAALGALTLTDTDETPLKFRPIQIVRTDAVPATLSPAGVQLLDRSALPILPDRLLLTF